MTIPLEALIDGAVRTLTEAVLPDVTSRFARGQLFAVVDVLRNLRDRLEVKAALHEAEAASAAAALERAAAALGREAAAARIAGARAAVTEHLAAQTMRDLALLKPSLLGEISKG